MKFFNSHPSEKIISKLTKNLSVLVTLQSPSHSYDEPEMAITLVIPEKRNIEKRQKSSFAITISERILLF